MLTPKEIGGTTPVFPVSIPFSALLEAGYSSTGNAADEASLALTFKPTQVVQGLPLADPAHHHCLLVRKSGGDVEVTDVGGVIATAPFTGTTYAELLAQALTAVCGSDCGYYSGLRVVEGACLSWDDFFEASPVVEGLSTWRKTPSWSVPGDTIFTGGTPSASSEYSTAYAAANAFDGEETGGAGSSWTVSGATTGWLQYELPTPCAMDGYYVHAYSVLTHTMRDWTVEGSDDGVAWDVLHTVEGEEWADSISKRFTLDTPGNHRFYRINITASNGGRPTVGEWKGYAFKENDYGPGGGHYPFTDGATPASLGTDVSGNNNHWTVSAGTQTVDTPTNNLPVLDPSEAAVWTLSAGNTVFVGNGEPLLPRCTLPCFDGCYWEVRLDSAGEGGAGVRQAVGVDAPDTPGVSWVSASGQARLFDGTVGASFTPDVGDNSVLMFAYVNGNLWAGADGVWSGDPATFSDSLDSAISGTVYPCAVDAGDGSGFAGRMVFARHEFTYTPPDGFRPLRETL